MGMGAVANNCSICICNRGLVSGVVAFADDKGEVFIE